ncbi:helix-turn-helix domain-containing protein [uncultured Jannaschia sp.]|uniref:ArsR/SmtB family transcription factor n=1 Tax=uncultured Jannaschia sp. TaxID=293347 RepID=UPI002613F6AF|nr:helix-turn-helix domain-containing protein [uncultured Jannaschia sp.]
MDSLFKALADPSRRDLLDALRVEDGQTLSQLEAASPLSRFGVAKHLGVLEDAGLVTRIRRGRFTHHYLNAIPVAEALTRWIEPFRVAPAARGVLDLKARLEAASPAPDLTFTIYIRCAQTDLWSALTEPARVAAYAALSPSGRDAGLPDTARLEPMSRIEATLAPEGHAASRYVARIAPEGAICALTIEHWDLAPADRARVADGWARTLSGLKTWLETGEALAFEP